ncbi:polysaccharide biosynthesis tyrosine autokinase [Thaumasiovibrio subtropicus]|uniref:polysaccharide biosynthesis tyrosine autokinase n=1 Tax=Thaumasiovibrio subtropicus TaxID=1891207 RepID=UPI000B354AAF|nr:polysaccharide biosynthesis tyrosine autokinase [Thaumasiovibrio subtropicus]
MTTNLNMPPAAGQESDEIDLGKLFGILLDSKWKIVACTFIFAVLGIVYALMATPIYKADAIIQVEQKSSGGIAAALGEMGDLFAQESSSSTEIEILKSRMVLGETVDNLNLTISAEPRYLPFLGEGWARLTGDASQIRVSRFEVPHASVSQGFTLVAESEKSYLLLDSEQKQVLQGTVGELVSKGGFSLLVTDLTLGTTNQFALAKKRRFDVITNLQRSLSVSERGKQTGILQLTLEGEDKNSIVEILNDISRNYFLQNVARNSAEAEKSLDFLSGHLPDIRSQLANSEDVLNAYRIENDSVDLGLEAKAVLDVMVKLEAQLNQLTFKESEISQKFTKEHPAYKSLLDKRATLLQEKRRFEDQISTLPKTQREVLRLTRDVEVNQQIYVQLLNKVQELNIVKASTVGNVRILDEAEAYTYAVKPKKPLIVILSTMFGGILGVAIALLKAAFHRGIESPDQIEAIGLPVYASVPMSDWQIEMDKKAKAKKRTTIEDTLLAASNSSDLSIESLRSLRTSLHFAMMEAKNNIIMISGPSPGIGKSFVSANMGAVIAKGGQRILVIDADMRKGRMEKQMSANRGPGLSDILVGKLKAEECVQDVGVENMDFIARGDVPPNPSELLMHPRFKTLMDWASAQYDMVLVDTPPILAVTDPAIVGAHAGTTLLVGRFNQNAVKEVEITKQRFEQNGIEVKGFILNAVVRKASSYYGGNYGYYNYSYSSSKA